MSSTRTKTAGRATRIIPGPGKLSLAGSSSLPGVKALGVTFEPFGKDHTSRGGSTDTADRMARTYSTTLFRAAMSMSG